LILQLTIVIRFFGFLAKKQAFKTPFSLMVL
jgi:hypothetical protein